MAHGRVNFNKGRMSPRMAKKPGAKKERPMRKKAGGGLKAGRMSKMKYNRKTKR